MANETPKLLTQTKTRTKVLLGVALAVIIGGIIVAAGGVSTNKKVCDSGPKQGKRCTRDNQCKSLTNPQAKCVPEPKPDLIVNNTIIQCWPDQGDVAVGVHVTNNGNASAGPFSFKAAAMRSDGSFVENTATSPLWTATNGLAPGAQTSGGILIPLTLVASEGIVAIQATVDNFNQVTESNETNNIVTTSFSCPLPLPEQNCTTGPQMGGLCTSDTQCRQPCTTQGYCAQGKCGGTLPAEPTITLVTISGISGSGSGFWTDLSYGEDDQSGWPQWTPAIPTPEVSVGQQVTGVLTTHAGTSTPTGGPPGFTVPLWSKITAGPTGIVVRDWTQYEQPGFSSINFTVTQEMVKTDDLMPGEQPYVPLAVFLRNDNGIYRLSPNGAAEAGSGLDADDLVKVKLRIVSAQ